jgi:Holliday junction resolvase RusA-like endonuclease
MPITITPGQLIVMAVLPMSPSVNVSDHPAIRKIKARSVLEEDRYIATKYKDPRSAAYAYQVKALLNYPVAPWRVAKSPLIREIREDKGIILDLEIWEYFRTRRKNDIDNRVKILQDALAVALDIDDCRITEGAQHKRTHRDLSECVVVKLTIAEPVDIWAEQAELDEQIEKYRNEEKVAKSSVVLY